MAKSQQSWNKQEKEKSRQKKKKDKEAKRVERQASARDGSNMDDMIAYVDEYGRITSTPPDPSAKGVIKAEDIEINVRNRNQEPKDESPKTGVVSFFNNTKAYGFIKDSVSNESYFVHANALESAIKEGDIVTFQVEKTFKGLSAIGVKVIKK